MIREEEPNGSSVPLFFIKFSVTLRCPHFIKYANVTADNLVNCLMQMLETVFDIDF